MWPYTPKIGKYQHSSPYSSGGADSACSLSKIFCMKATKYYFISGLFSSVRCSEVRQRKACSLLWRSRCLCVRNGIGATKLFELSMKDSSSIIYEKYLSSTEGANLSSSFVVKDHTSKVVVDCTLFGNLNEGPLRTVLLLTFAAESLLHVNVVGTWAEEGCAPVF